MLKKLFCVALIVLCIVTLSITPWTAPRSQPLIPNNDAFCGELTLLVAVVALFRLLPAPDHTKSETRAGKQGTPPRKARPSLCPITIRIRHERNRLRRNPNRRH